MGAELLYEDLDIRRSRDVQALLELFERRQAEVTETDVGQRAPVPFGWWTRRIRFSIHDTGTEKGFEALVNDLRRLISHCPHLTTLTDGTATFQPAPLLFSPHPIEPSNISSLLTPPSCQISKPLSHTTALTHLQYKFGGPTASTLVTILRNSPNLTSLSLNTLNTETFDWSFSTEITLSKLTTLSISLTSTETSLWIDHLPNWSLPSLKSLTVHTTENIGFVFPLYALRDFLITHGSKLTFFELVLPTAASATNESLDLGSLLDLCPNLEETVWNLRWTPSFRLMVPNHRIRRIGLRGCESYPGLWEESTRLGMADAHLSTILSQGSFPNLETVTFLDRPDTWHSKIGSVAGDMWWDKWKSIADKPGKGNGRKRAIRFEDWEGKEVLGSRYYEWLAR